MQNTVNRDGDEAVHALLDVMYAKRPYTVISRAVHIHPTVAELITDRIAGAKIRPARMVRRPIQA